MSKQEASSTEVPSQLLECLTEKQYRAVREATEAGFFDRPQKATADEVAEQLGVSRSTFLYHLRGAEQQIFEQAFDGGHDQADDG